MSNAVAVLKKFGIKPYSSVTAAITQVGLAINESGSPLDEANRIIVSLGGAPVSKTVQADIIAKALIEQAVVNGNKYIPASAVSIAEAKYQRIVETMPYVFAGSDQDTRVVQAQKTTSKRGGDKKERALEIYNREKGKAGSDVAKIIAAELEISYANAYYYVSRVFAKYKK